ncbi:MAG: tRNA 4-thiouridine(8) synthase ThiI, partial [Clostridia bacterium]|nr:tRNA 4-thiouridine(8) synthase ThiI [Clostridia bacterium]
MRIAERICNQNGLGCIITGENLGQVASQTMESMTVTNDVVEKLPVFRPLVAFDKEGIIEIAKKIGTFETSILPYEDCCTVFLPKNPVIKPTVKQAEYEEKFLNIEDLIGQALQDEEIIVLNKEY